LKKKTGDITEQLWFGTRQKSQLLRCLSDGSDVL
jgi:hypothetical protein